MLVFAFPGAQVAVADTVAITGFENPFLAHPDIDATYGWYFNTSETIIVTALGIGDLDGDGLTNSHEVGIFRVSDQALVLYATVPSGGTGILIDQFRYVAITPFALAADSYVILTKMLANDGDFQSLNNSWVTTSYPVIYEASTFGTPGTLTFPDPVHKGAYDEGVFGPNFTFTVVPEPTSLLLLGTGLCLIGLCVWRRKP